MIRGMRTIFLLSNGTHVQTSRKYVGRKVKGMNTRRDYTYIGKSCTRVDGYEKVTGKAVYGADFKVANELVAVSLYAPKPHIRILAIDPSEALAMQGVAAVATAADVPGNNEMIGRFPVFADKEAKYAGDVLAVVAAENLTLAKEAVKRITVRYEELPGVWSLEEALNQDAPLVHQDAAQNEMELTRYPLRKGDAAAGFAEAEEIYEGSYRVGFQDQAYIETESIVVLPAPFQHGFEVYGCIQNPYTIRTNVATVLGLPESSIRVVLTAIGGSFGGKDEASMSMAARCAVLSRMTGRPVRMDLTREQSLLESCKRHPFILNYKVGLRSDGTISALQSRLICQGGAYNNKARFSNWRGVVHTAGAYRIENIQADLSGKYTNTIYGGAYRGFSGPQVLFGIETMIDEIAAEKGQNPKDFRLQHVLREGDTIACGQLLKEGYIAAPLTRMIQETAERAEFDKKWELYPQLSSQEPGIKKGIGIAITYRGAGLGGEGVDSSSAMLTVCRDGSILLFSGHTEMGQGMRTAHAQIAAEALGVAMHRIDFKHSDTSITLDGGPTVASRGTQSGGRAVLDAAQKLLKQLLEAGAAKTGYPVSELTLQDDTLCLNTGEPLCSFEELVSYCVYPLGTNLSAQGWYSPGLSHIDPETQQGDCYQTYTHGVAISEITVDEATGKITVDNMTVAYELGTAVNPELAYGQFVGGLVQGIGYALFEEMAERKGELLTLNFDEYLIPTTMDVPVMDLKLYESVNPEGPYGAKGIGEIGIELAAPSIGNALFHATGKRLRELPLNLERVKLGKSLTR